MKNEFDVWTEKGKKAILEGKLKPGETKGITAVDFGSYTEIIIDVDVDLFEWADEIDPDWVFIDREMLLMMIASNPTRL